MDAARSPASDPGQFSTVDEALERWAIQLSRRQRRLGRGRDGEPVPSLESDAQEASHGDWCRDREIPRPSLDRLRDAVEHRD
ncbi:hypothetical protein PC129_g11317 [Phytophthora cactorum]|uniref:Uncharacterized protein n=1 Tax=Phytophthora cactorum TaxID=29920 RepID=A0A8T1FLS6_9STRA|nr:hypothetical protein PC112_g12517 [Phytophthora cactorum]KAG2819285.1 hypothetical protein PC111_g11958 [Phytophthora cactorum]KAG2854703.1 hypothetical protein PC113_g13064 [Phytophthora cactorum]KAG2927671.1 hypothetical protein PC115_g7443 [Phytophthora cactorum]KAG2978250.1 hypothetical protein PC118_g12402 [Phytophthora cactorum]